MTDRLSAVRFEAEAASEDGTTGFQRLQRPSTQGSMARQTTVQLRKGQSITGSDSQSVTGSDSQSVTGPDSQSVTGSGSQSVTGSDSQSVTGSGSQSVTF